MTSSEIKCDKEVCYSEHLLHIIHQVLDVKTEAEFQIQGLKPVTNSAKRN